MRSVFNLVPDFEPRCFFILAAIWIFSCFAHVKSYKKTPPSCPNHHFRRLRQPPHITLLRFRHRSTLANALDHRFPVLALSRHRLWPHTSPYQTHYMDGRYDIVSGEFNHQFLPPLHPLSSITLTNTFMKHQGGRGGSRSMHHGHFTAYSPHPA